ncbi:MAG: hypothetical protein V3R80_01490 [Candidatus Tectomicrobia bacterium]
MVAKAELMSKQYEFPSWEAAQEFYHREGCTGGLPVIPPTEERVAVMLDGMRLRPGDVVAEEPVRGKVFTAEKVAINAVMAGCLSEYMPVLVAALQGMVEPRFNLHTVTTSTNGPAIMLVVSGAIVQQLGLNSGTCLFGVGPRANATIGRAVNLIVLNYYGSQPDSMDKATLGHAGKYTSCIAENDALLGEWTPLRVDKGAPVEASTVTVMGAMAPWQVDDHHSHTPQGIVSALALTALGLGPDQQEVLVILCPEHLFHIHRAGWSKEQLRQALFQRAALPLREWQAWDRLTERTDQAPDTMIPVISSPESITLITAGGGGGGFSAIVQGWGGSRSVTKTIALPPS